MKSLVLIAFMLFSSGAFSSSYSFLLKDSRYPHRPFSVTLPASNIEGVDSFESYLVKGRVRLDDQGNPDIGVMTSTLIKTQRSSRHDWDFGMNPHELGFADFTTEVCDGQFTDIEQDPDYWFNVVGRYCPWSTRWLMQEIRRDGKVIFRREKK